MDAVSFFEAVVTEGRLSYPLIHLKGRPVSETFLGTSFFFVSFEFVLRSSLCLTMRVTIVLCFQCQILSFCLVHITIMGNTKVKATLMPLSLVFQHFKDYQIRAEHSGDQVHPGKFCQPERLTF